LLAKASHQDNCGHFCEFRLLFFSSRSALVFLPLDLPNNAFKHTE
jgi:hypothetical protein